jgi:hypothetical protein
MLDWYGVDLVKRKVGWRWFEGQDGKGLLWKYVDICGVCWYRERPLRGK